MLPPLKYSAKPQTHIMKAPPDLTHFSRTHLRDASILTQHKALQRIDSELSLGTDRHARTYD